jgi:beta-lactamase class A
MIDRRTLLAGFVALAACSGAAESQQSESLPASRDPQPDFAPILASLGANARLGVAALDTGSGRTIGHDPDSRYAMCSTFKLPLAAAILAEVDRGAVRLDEELAFGRGDIVSNSPVAEANLARGRMTVEEACRAIVEVSDNAAANLLMRRTGGPEALTAFFRRCGDGVSRIDRYEVALNTNVDGDPRDTTAAAAMLGSMRAYLLGDVLTPASRVRLIGWLEGCRTGPDRLLAGIPEGWRFGHKTGTGANGAANDVGIAFPPNRAPILIASYLSAPATTPAKRAAAHASVARLVAQALA